MITWSKVSGPGTVTFASPNAATTTATFSAPGVYVLRLAAHDGVLSSSDDVGVTVSFVPGNYAVQFGGTDAYISVPDSSKLHLSAFTLETWFRRDGAGVGTNTGNGGIASMVPLIAKGRAESETATTDINYFFGIDTNGNVLAADFEEGQAGVSPSLNHPVRGITAITNGMWHHAAATYDGTTWRLYLDGVLDANEQTTTTDKNGQYIFTGLAEGTYKVRLLDGRGWRQTSPTNDRPLSVTIKTGEHSVANNFFVRHGRGHQKHRGR